MPEPPDLSVSIVTCNSEQWLPSLLASLEAQQGVRWELFVVDNASSDRTLSILGERQRGEIIRNVENVGFGPATINFATGFVAATFCS